MALPLPQPFSSQPGGPLINAMNGLYANQVNRANANYAPYQAYANAFKTMQEAKWLPYQYQMQAYSNPMLWMAAQNNPKLMEQLKSIGSTPLPTGGVNVPEPGGSDNNGNSILSTIISKITGGVKSLNPFAQGGGQAEQPVTNPIAAGTEFGEKNRASDQEVADIAANGNHTGTTSGAPAANTGGYTTPGAQQAANTAGSGGLNGVNPLTSAEAQQKAQEARVTGETTNQNQQKTERSKLISNQATIGTDALKSLEAFSRNYDKSSFKGSKLGSTASSGLKSPPTLPGSDLSQEQLTDRYANQFLTTLSALGDTPAGKTDDGRELIAGGKVDRSLDPSAKDELVDSYKAKLHRMINGRDFANEFYKNNPNATDEDLVAMMNLYNRNSPAYDYDKGKSLPQNDKKYKDYASADALQTYKNIGDYRPHKPIITAKVVHQPEHLSPKQVEKENLKVQGKMPPPGTSWMTRPDGLMVPVHESNMKAALKLNYRKVQ